MIKDIENLDSDDTFLITMALHVKSLLREFINHIHTQKWARLTVDGVTISDHINKLGYIAGGCTASIMNGSIPKDYDMYLKDPSIATKIINQIIDKYPTDVALFSDNKYGIIIDDSTKKLARSRYAIKLKNKLQIIDAIGGDPKEVTSKFDFKHCTPYYDICSDKFYISKQAFWSIRNRTLIKADGSRPPCKERIEKFKALGWKMDQL